MRILAERLLRQSKIIILWLEDETAEELAWSEDGDHEWSWIPKYKEVDDEKEEV